jgi:hypothetical protein
VSVAVGLLVGVEVRPEPEDLEVLIAEGVVPEEGLRLVNLTLTASVASRREALQECYRAACVQQGWLDGLAFVDDLRFADLVVHGRRIVVVVPKVVDADRATSSPPDPPSDGDLAEGRPVPVSPTSQVEQRLREAGPTTLHGCDRILAVVVVHERAVGMIEPGASPGGAIFGLTPERIARGFVEDYKRQGWVPAGLRVDDDTAITVLQRPDSGQLTTSQANAFLAETLAASVPGADLSACTAISFSGENDVFGHTRLAILATTTDRDPTAVGR